LSLTLAACAGDTARTPTTLRDSAGIRIVDNGAPVWTDGNGWTIAAEPDVVIGRTGDPHYEFERVQGVTRLGDGSIVVLNTGARELRFYDAAGVYLRTVGREGRGPGEFRSPKQLLRRGDTLLVWDQASELTYLLPDGTQLDRVSLRHPEVWPIVEQRQAEGPLNLATVFSALLPDGSVLAYAPGMTSAPGAIQGPTDRWGMRYFLFDPEDRTVKDLGLYYGPPGGDGGGLGSSPIGSSYSAANVLHAAHGDPLRLAIGGTERYDITVFGPDGAQLQRIRRDQPARPIADADRQAIRRAKEAELLQPGQNPAEFPPWAEGPRGQVFPHFDAMIYDLAAHLWVRDNAMLWDSTATWRVFAPDGIYLGPVEAPAHLDVLEIGPDYLLGLVRDALGVETIHLHTLQREP
jgi:hypothetical protein